MTAVPHFVCWVFFHFKLFCGSFSYLSFCLEWPRCFMHLIKWKQIILFFPLVLIVLWQPYFMNSTFLWDHPTDLMENWSKRKTKKTTKFSKIGQAAGFHNGIFIMRTSHHSCKQHLTILGHQLPWNPSQNKMRNCLKNSLHFLKPARITPT